MQTIRMIAKNLAKSADGDIPAGEQMAYASYITGMVYPTSASVWCTAWPTRWAAASAWRTVWPTASCWPRSWNTTSDYTGEKYRDIADVSVSPMPTLGDTKPCVKRPGGAISSPWI